MFDLTLEENLENLYPLFQRLRNTSPVCRLDPFGHIAVSRYDDVVSVLRNPKVFSSFHVSNQVMEPGPSMVAQDPPGHTRLRAVVNKAFTPASIAALEPRVREIAHRLLERVIARGS